MTVLIVNSLRAGMKNSHLCIPHSSLSEEGTSANVWWIALRPPSLRTNLSTETKSWTAVFPSITHQAPHLCLHTHCLLRLWHIPLPTCLLLPHEVWSPSLPHNSHTHTHTHTCTRAHAASKFFLWHPFPSLLIPGRVVSITRVYASPGVAQYDLLKCREKMFRLLGFV